MLSIFEKIFIRDSAYWHKIAFILGVVLVLIVSARAIVAGNFGYLSFILFLALALFLYLKQIEFFILLLLIMNQELFYLFPLGISLIGRYYYQDFLYVAFVLIGGWYILSKGKIHDLTNSNIILSFLGLVLIGIICAWMQGQPLRFGLSVTKSYFLILYYYLFMGREININKLFKLIIFTGAVLLFLNNIQYLFFENLNIFHFDRFGERVGTLRFLVGGFFIIFATILAFAEFLRCRKRIYLIMFIYMLGVITLQGQTRIVIWGFMITILLLLYISKRIKFNKIVSFGLPLLVLFFWLLPLFQSTLFARLYGLTRYEFEQRGGHVGIRLDTYEYYIKEVMKSPIIGRGVWSDGYNKNNPENMKERGLHLSDIGVMSIIFHFGLLGVFWLILGLKNIFKTQLAKIKRYTDSQYYSLVGYFIFVIAVMPTLNVLVSRRSIIYFALVLAIISQLESFDHKSKNVINI